ncbi:MAG: hypothetical protein E7123_05895 [Bacteroidales bacterium]|nr:hypothetical protein [Bacteroidales bacterium]
MLHHNTLYEIETNTNTGVEYEIALFYKLISNNSDEQSQVKKAIRKRLDSDKVEEIMRYTNTSKILTALRERGLTLKDASFETQNDEVGPADVVLFAEDKAGKTHRIGLSIKFANTCTLDVTGRKFITDEQIKVLKEKYITKYIPEFKVYMKATYGHAENWHRKQHPITERMIDEIRDAVILNWPKVKNKVELMKNLFHDTSPIEFWVVNYSRTDYALKTKPSTIDMSRANDVVVKKYQTSYVAFYVDDVRVGRMQVKFNNGFVESNFNHKGLRKKQTSDFIVDGLEFIYGQPFGSWNFSVED